MFGAELVTRTKFIPPRLPASYLHRPRLYRQLEQVNEFPLALLVAGTGYGKSALLAGYLARGGTPALWYGLAERDADPQVWTLHLAHLCERAFPGSAARALHLLAWPGGAAQHGRLALEALADALLDRIEQETWLVLDDAQWLEDSPQTLALANHFVHFLPPRLHLVIAARHQLDLTDLPRWRLRGELLELAAGDLAFRADEAQELCASLGQGRPPAERVQRLLAATEGWPIALQLLARSGNDATADTPTALFDYLAHEVLARLPEEDQEFLLRTAPLRLLRPDACAALTGQGGAAPTLRRLTARGLFLLPLGGGVYRHHHLFREFLLRRLDRAGRLAEAHRAAAAALDTCGEPEEALDQYLAGGAGDEAALLLARLAPELIRANRYTRMTAWLEQLPPDAARRLPALALAQGDACRMTARFGEALSWYERAREAYGDDAAGASQALVAQAQVYLDTVQPAQADRALEAALAQASGAGTRLEVLLLLAENKINQGEAAAAEPLLRQAAAVGPRVVEHEARLRLRTGRLAEARDLLRAALDAPAGVQSTTKAHREAVLVLSLIEALLGDGDEALRLAELGLARARQQQAPWTEAVACIRRAHARALLGDSAAATADYRQALARAEALRVRRLEAEPLWGLTLLAGDGREAEPYAARGLAAATNTGDGWMASLLALALGRAYARADDQGAVAWLERAQQGFERSSDTFGQAVAALWAAHRALAGGDPRSGEAEARTALDFIRRYGYDFLFLRPTLLGFDSNDQAASFIARVLAAGVSRASLPATLAHLAPAVTGPAEDGLQICCLGGFRITRGAAELTERSWGRAKASELLHVLIAHRNQPLNKERLVDLLWPDAGPEAGGRSLRVVLSALNKALEPERPPGHPPRYVLRRGQRYQLASEPLVQMDVADFERLLDAAHDLETAGQDAVDTYRQALDVYQGPFLACCAGYESWCDRERERLAARYAQGVLRLIRLLSTRNDTDGIIYWAERLLARDSCAEEAHRALMLAHHQRGETTQALRAYERCAAALRAELDVVPSAETRDLLASIRDQEAITGS